MTTILRLATIAKNYLRRDVHRNIVVLADGTPEWVISLCKDAHSGMSADDWRYELIEDVLNALSEDDSDDQTPYAHTLYDCNDRLKWVSSRTDRSGYCDDVMSEKWTPALINIDRLLALAMQTEMQEVFDLVREALAEQAERSSRRLVAVG